MKYIGKLRSSQYCLKKDRIYLFYIPNVIFIGRYQGLWNITLLETLSTLFEKRYMEHNKYFDFEFKNNNLSIMHSGNLVFELNEEEEMSYIISNSI